MLVGKENQWWSTTIDLYAAPTPVGPFSGPGQSYTIPEHGEPCGSSTMFTYRVKPHSEFVQDDGTVMVSYNVHCFDPVGNWSNVYVYRARFVGLELPD